MSNDKPAIITTGLAAFSAQPSAPALARKGELLELASLILSVNTEEEELDAIDAASQIKGVEKGIEDSRKEIKLPILDAGAAIDTAAKDYLADLTKERLRIESLLTARAVEKRRAYEAEQTRLREEAEARQRAEQARLDAEYAQEAALAAALDQPAPAPAPVVPVVMSAPAMEAPRMEGASFREQMDFEVTDIHALYEWSRLFVKLEVDRANLKAWINMPGNKPESIPGIRVFQKAGATVRAARSREIRVIE